LWQEQHRTLEVLFDQSILNWWLFHFEFLFFLTMLFEFPMSMLIVMVKTFEEAPENLTVKINPKNQI
jgi:hypothetical protein